MSPPTVSVVITSRHRPEALMLCLTGLAQLWYPTFEIVVVADPGALARLARRPDAARLRLVSFDEPNISAARNAGIAAAAGEIIAFIDDDAVPEPTWLDHLIAPFADPAVGCAGGFVRGRNGISFQWQARQVDATGFARPLALPGTAPVILRPDGDWVPKTEGTNMAVRRDLLVALGGFDPAYRFYLDETDLNRRLSAMGQATALVPLAQVHHGFAPSERRRADRMPLSLREIGASSAVFLDRHAPARREAALDRLRDEQHRRLVRHMIAGTAEPRDIPRLMADLDQGIAEAASRTCGPVAIAAPKAAFLPWRDRPAPPPRSVLLLRRGADPAPLLPRAMALREAGAVVTLATLTPDPRALRTGLSETGFWHLRGGLYGRAERDARRIATLPSRHTLGLHAAHECTRLAGIRVPPGGHLETEFI